MMKGKTNWENVKELRAKGQHAILANEKFATMSHT